MNSIERHEARYKRRVAKREARRRERSEQYDNYDDVMSFENLYRSADKIVLGVAWKASIQRFIKKKPSTVYKIYGEVARRTYAPDPFYEFEIHERGKVRRIRSCTVRDRNVQRCLCDYSLVPLISQSFIYDNGASMKGKGYHFSIRRLEHHLREHYVKHGNDGYILLFDFSKFFDNVPHDVLERIINSAYTDCSMRDLIMDIVRLFGPIGLGLGSHVSQLLALASANALDHYIKEVLRIKGYGRYMDDGYLIHESKEYLGKCLEEIKRICDELGIVLNLKKTHIVKISHGFTYIKSRFIVTDSGKIIRKMPRRSITKMRQKMKKLKKKYDAGLLTDEQIYQAYQSWRAYAKGFNAYRTIQSMDALYKELFSGKGDKFI